jgi:hypothetical protein
LDPGAISCGTLFKIQQFHRELSSGDLQHRNEKKRSAED